MQLLTETDVESVLHSIRTYAPRLILALLLLLIAWIVIRVLLGLVRRSLRLAKVERTAVTLSLACLRVGAWAFALAAVFRALGLDQVSLGLTVLTALSGAVLATGASGSVADILGGVFLVADPGFVVGRRVNAGGVEGILKEITLRKTVLEDAEGNIHVIPNRTVDSSPYVLRRPESPAQAKEAGREAVE